MFKRSLVLVFVSISLVYAALGQGGSATASSETDTSVTRAPAFRPTKNQILQGQKLLKEQKLYNGDATGVYNDDTRAGIKSYQKANGLAITGKFNQATLEKMKIALTDKQKGAATGIVMPVESTAGKAGVVSPTDSTATKTSTDSKASTITGHTTISNPSATADPKRPAPFQATKEQIMALQKALKDAKLFTGEADGERSDALKEAVTSYQKANDLKTTGGINAATLDKMGIALTDKQKEQVAAQAAYEAAKAAQKN